MPYQPELFNTEPATPAIVYKPSELLGIIASYFSQQDVNKQVIFLQGIYWSNPKHNPQWAYRYDKLRDENTQSEITLQIPHKLAGDLKDGSLVTVGGMLSRKMQNDGYIQIQLLVSRIDVVQDQAIDEDEIKRMEIRRAKATKGFRNVDAILEQLLFTDNRPKVALIFASTSITMSDFNAGIQAAKAAIDFVEQRVNFANSAELCQRLKAIDGQHFDVLALVRGGGGGIENLDDLDVLQTVADLQTPLIAAIGHVEEKLFIKQIADKEAPTPNGLGQYFSNMVEEVSEKKTRSRAALTEQIKKQFKEQLEAGQKQNKELQEKLAALTKNQQEAAKQHGEQVLAAQKQNKELQEKLTTLTKSQEEATKKHNEQVEAAQKQNKELQDKLASLTKSQEETAKKHNEQVLAAQKQNKDLQDKLNAIQKANSEQQQKQNIAQNALQDQLKQQQKAADDRAKELNESIQKMQQSNGELQKSLSLLTTQNAQATSDRDKARDQARDLERQLMDLQSKGGGNKTAVIVAAVIITAIITAIICTTLI